MKRRSMKQQRRQKSRPYKTKIRLKTNGRSRDPRWMWWTENVGDVEELYR